MILAEYTPDEAREWAKEELTKEKYQEHSLSLLERITQVITDFLSTLQERVFNFQSVWTVLILGLLVIGLIAIVICVRRGAGSSLGFASEKPEFFHTNYNPDQFRSASIAAAEVGNWEMAICERIRAIMAELAQREEISIRTASTASELATQAAAARPEHGDQLQLLGVIFDTIAYGRAQGSPEDYDWISSLDDKLTQRVAS